MTSKHQAAAEVALIHAVRFIAGTGHTGNANGTGSSWAPLPLSVRICNASIARMYAELAVHEAAHARDDAGVEGPTELQVEASRLADVCTRLTEQLAHDIERGALRDSQTSQTSIASRG